MSVVDEPGRYCASIEVSLRFIRPAVTGRLSIDRNPYISVIRDLAVFPDAAPGASVHNEAQPFVVAVSPGTDTPDGLLDALGIEHGLQLDAVVAASATTRSFSAVVPTLPLRCTAPPSTPRGCGPAVPAGPARSVVPSESSSREC